MDDQALEVLKAAKATEDVLATKAQSLAAVRTEFERKQKEVYTSSVHISLHYITPYTPPQICLLPGICPCSAASCVFMGY